jgi:transcription initiation factor TFIIIB Brf1 subunit/transcription initiation factor TFIIB
VPQSVVEETESLVKRFFEVVAGLPLEVVAVAVLWTAAKAAGVPRPLEDFLKCSRAEERRMRRVAWRLKEVMKLGRRPSVGGYVKTLAARVGLPASIVKASVKLLERNRRVLSGKNHWVWAALWLASSKRLGLLKALAEAAGTTTVSIRKAAERIKVCRFGRLGSICQLCFCTSRGSLEGASYNSFIDPTADLRGLRV